MIEIFSHHTYHHSVPHPWPQTSTLASWRKLSVKKVPDSPTFFLSSLIPSTLAQGSEITAQLQFVKAQWGQVSAPRECRPLHFKHPTSSDALQELTPFQSKVRLSPANDPVTWSEKKKNLSQSQKLEEPSTGFVLCYFCPLPPKALPILPSSFLFQFLFPLFILTSNNCMTLGQSLCLSELWASSESFCSNNPWAAYFQACWRRLR